MPRLSGDLEPSSIRRAGGTDYLKPILNPRVVTNLPIVTPLPSAGPTGPGVQRASGPFCYPIDQGGPKN
jgi:hypothetical protein